MSVSYFGKQEGNAQILSKPDNENTFSVLGDNKLSIEYPCMSIIPQIFKGSPNNFPCFSLVMGHEVFYIFKEKCLRLVVGNDSCNMEE